MATLENRLSVNQLSIKAFYYYVKVSIFPILRKHSFYQIIKFG